MANVCNIIDITWLLMHHNEANKLYFAFIRWLDHLGGWAPHSMTKTARIDPYFDLQTPYVDSFKNKKRYIWNQRNKLHQTKCGLRNFEKTFKKLYRKLYQITKQRCSWQFSALLLMVRKVIQTFGRWGQWRYFHSVRHRTMLLVSHFSAKTRLTCNNPRHLHFKVMRSILLSNGGCIY